MPLHGKFLMTMNKTEISPICKEILFRSDAFLLKGTLHLPAAVTQPPVVIGSHGLFSTGNSPKQIALAQECNRRGIAFFRFDHRGCGESQGLFHDVTSLESRCRDLIHAAEMIRGRADTGNALAFFGSSMGGAVCMATAATVFTEAVSLVTLAAPVCIRSHHEAMKAIEKSGDSHLPEPLFYEKNLQFDLSALVPELRNILIFHGDSDEVIPVSDALKIYQNARHPKKLIIQKQGDHRMSNEEHQREFITQAVNWFEAGFLLSGLQKT